MVANPPREQTDAGAISKVLDRLFGGILGRVVLISMLIALVLLTLWGMERIWVPRYLLNDYDHFQPWRWWNSIIPLAMIALLSMLARCWETKSSE